jgi:PAS domain S-box-containing protein
MDNSVHGHLKQLLVDILPDCALVVLDTDGKVLSWNVGAQGLLGYTEGEAVGLSFSRIVPPETLDPAGAPPSLAIARKSGRHVEVCQRMHSDGSDHEVREIVIPLRDPQHTLVAFGIMMQSVGAPGNAEAGRPLMVSKRQARKVLLVDDDGDVRLTAVNLLKGLGYEVLTAASGAEALDILARDEGIDVLFTDVMMPGGMDGGEVAEKARAIRPAIKVLFASGYFEDALIKKGNIAANTHLLVKPYRRRDLAKMLNMILADEIRGSDDFLLVNR